MVSKIDEHLTNGLAWLRLQLTTSEGICWLFLAFGLVLRVQEYAYDRQLYLDEGALLTSLSGVGIFEMSPLAREQIAPPGFLVIERVAGRLLGTSKLALRLLPLLCSIVALELTRRVAFRFVDRRAALVAVALFAVSHDLIYYASEIKQYSSDVVCSLVGLLLGDRLRRAPVTPRWLVLAAVAGALMIWSSYAAVFVLAGIGAVLLASALRQRSRPLLAQAALLGICWGASALGCYLVSQRLLARPGFMQFFWGPVAFPSLRVGSRADVQALAWHILNLYNNPLDFHTPLGSMLSIWLGLLLTVVGAVALGRQDLGRLGMLMLPIALAFGAGVLRAYPFHGRLLNYLIPMFDLLIAAGLFAIGHRLSQRLWVALVVLIVIQPTWDAILHLSRARERASMTHGDLRRDLWFDYVPAPSSGPGRW